MENGATVLEGCRLISVVQMPEPTTVATSTVKASPARASTPVVVPRVVSEVPIRPGPSTSNDTASIGSGGTTVIQRVSRSGCGARACRLARLPSAHPSPPHRVRTTGSR